MTEQAGPHICLRRRGHAWHWAYVVPATENTDELELPASVGFLTPQDAWQDAQLAYPGIPLQSDSKPQPDSRPAPHRRGRAWTVALLRAALMVLGIMIVIRVTRRRQL